MNGFIKGDNVSEENTEHVAGIKMEKAVFCEHLSGLIYIRPYLDIEMLKETIFVPPPMSGSGSTSPV